MLVLDPYVTHIPVLAAAVARTSGPVLELGAGWGSTPMLHLMCHQTTRHLTTLETDERFFELFGRLQSPLHELRQIESWTDDPTIESRPYWGLAFVDCAPGEERAGLISRLRGRCRLIVAHDSETDLGAGGNYGYEAVKEGFRYTAEYRLMRPYTLVLSEDMPFDLDPAEREWIAP